ncbi:MAG: dihydropteroate synthase [Saprospiraceae bacterium]|nr:dihydropteroate synthase [Saprospiraceae bacterium]
MQDNETIQTTLNCRGHLLSLEEPVVMGILNVTPDSFYDGGRYTDLDAALFQVDAMLGAGAAIIDIGGMSSRPGAEILLPDAELKRVLPIVKAIAKRFPEAILSIDTIYSKTAKTCAEAGVAIINDISGGRFDDTLFQTVADLGLPYVLMHMKGEPGNMQGQAVYQDIVTEVLDFFIEGIGRLRALGVRDILLDPGFGFGKTAEHNFRLLNNLHVFQLTGCPVVAGISRKSMIWKSLKITPEEALNGTTALHMVALQQGARVLRAHDVRPAMETIQLWKTLNTYS